MKGLLVLAVVIPAALTLMTGCQGPFKPAGFKELVPERAEEMSKAAKESAFSIIVTIDREYRVFLNDENVGTTEDVSLLKEKLTQALERRKQSYRAGAGNGSPVGNEGADQRVVFVRAPSSFKYGEVSNVIGAIKGVGGEPVGLQENSPDTSR